MTASFVKGRNSVNPDRWQAKREKERHNERQRRNHPAYRHGMETGSEIGLNDQVKGKSQGAIR